MRSLPRLLLAIAAAVCVIDGVLTVLGQPFMVDLEIPLRAASRWAAGGEPYLAGAFAPGVSPSDLPFLYPPPVLPLLAPLAALPRPLVVIPWLALTIGSGTWLLRRLDVPWRAVPFGLAWVPFSEGLVGGNVQVLLAAGFVAAFTSGPRRPARSLADGIAVAATPALKLSQPHGWVALLRVRPGAALAGLGAMAALAAATLPLTGLSAWGDWASQLGRAADPAWSLRGSSLVSLLPVTAGLAVTALTVLAVLLVPRGRLPGWAGTLLVIGAPSLRNYGVLFLLPALRVIRPEIALLAIILVGCGVAPAVWAGIAVTVAGLLAARRTDYTRPRD